MSSPSLVPDLVEPGPLYFVLCDYGPKVGRAFVETDPDAANRQAIVRAIAEGQYTRVGAVWAVNIEAGIARDVTAEIMADVGEMAGA